ncbi:CoA transferase [Yinghuangia sp. ASG 101]|uniref:CaiB/BaiF CoA-transferase family protein n=1 Tax=Yinghuangia sp. ASG 101 TaxID=2896848 RepID=UPI001E4ED0E5|nr:CoA transferase [Yinghuangia sp. ASG 101]UGQ12470.1 CoA transferase [Yinghuangia sp. ASG 101]
MTDSHSTVTAALPCAGLTVVEIAVGVSDLGLGMAGGVPGMMLADLGAEVVRVVGTDPVPIDREVPWGRAWHRDKRVVATDDPDEIRRLLAGADAALVYGHEDLVERRGLGYRDLAEAAPGLVHVRCRPSRTSRGTVDDYALLVEANAGFCTQLAGHRPGPIFVNVHASDSGAALLLTASVLGLLRRRALTGRGGWAETSLYDGMLAPLGCMIGRSERAAPPIEGYWEKGSYFPNFLYRCADDELVQVWFGGKGMYAKLIDVLGDEPSTEGYYTDQVTGALNARAERWKAFFAARPRDHWITRLRAVGVACEPVLAPGEALADPHVAEIGLAVPRDEHGHRDVVIGTPVSVRPFAPPEPAHGPVGEHTSEPSPEPPLTFGFLTDRLLPGVRVLDLSAFVAGPLAAQVLADLGADVVKVEPPEGEAMRAAAYAVAACQRGKRSLALDLTAPESRPVVERLVRWADVVVHNFRVGVAERLGVDEATVAGLNPHAVYCHASAFGTTGPRAKFPGNDALMQAVTGLERAVGGHGNDPVGPTWIPIDMTGGWVSAIGILAGLYARDTTGRGQRVITSLLGAGMLLNGGVFRRDGELVSGPELDDAQTGFGPGYRIYRAGDGNWFALVVPDPDAWTRLRSLPEAAGLPEAYAPLRGGTTDAEAAKAEAVLEAAFASGTAAAWVVRLRDAGLLVEPIDALDRDGFRRRVLDDPVNRRMGRVVTYEAFDWGRFEQLGPLLNWGPPSTGRPRLELPGIGEHTVSVLEELGFTPREIDALVAAKAARRP